MSYVDLRFPQVRYRKTALKAVVCQLRFNPILRIGQEVPAAFQEHIRELFPRFQREESIELRLVLGQPAPALPPPAMSIWRFKSEDEAWTLGLGVEFLSLETSSYLDFPDFERRFLRAYEALETIYKIDTFIRLGLRYINIFTPKDFPGGWLGRFNNSLLGPLADPILGSEVSQCQQIFVLSADSWSITARHGTENGSYRLDLDHAIEGHIDPSEIQGHLKAFNDRLYQVFRWAISDTLHSEMEAKARE